MSSCTLFIRCLIIKLLLVFLGIYIVDGIEISAFDGLHWVYSNLVNLLADDNRIVLANFLGTKLPIVKCAVMLIAVTVDRAEQTPAPTLEPYLAETSCDIRILLTVCDTKRFYSKMKSYSNAYP